MMHLHLIFVGKTSFQEIETGIQRYLSRLCHYVSTQVHLVRAERISPKCSDDLLLEREGTRILKLFGNQGHLVAWDRGGREMDSVGLARFMEGLSQKGISTTWMVVGGPLGVHSSVLERSSAILSLSKMTLPHDLARLVLVEQLYRAFTIMKGEPYHK